MLKEEELLQNWRAASKAIFEPSETMKLENEYSGCEGKSNISWRDKGSLLDMTQLICVVKKRVVFLHLKMELFRLHLYWSYLYFYDRPTE